MPSSSQSRRVIFIDLARSVAVVFMLYGHAVSALLDPIYRQGRWYDAWQFQRGLTSSLFLLLSGFAFSIATARHWSSHLQWSPALVRRARRFSLFIALGYALHFPVYHYSQFWNIDPVRWRGFLAVDVLQLIGVTFFAVQALVMITRSRRVFTGVALALALILVCLTPAAYAVDWHRHLPPVFAAYLGPSGGSLFPLLPWAAFVLVGAALGQMYARWGATALARYSNFVLLLPGVCLVVVGQMVDRLLPTLFGTGPFKFIPAQFLVRVGACLLIMGVLAHGSARLTRLPHVFGAVAQETLLIYFVHLCIVYGSIWSPGLTRVYGETLTPGPMLGVVVALVGTMVLLAWGWNWCKHARPRVAKWVIVAVWTVLALRLI